MTIFVVIMCSVVMTVAGAILAYCAYDTVMTIREIDKVSPRELFMMEYYKIKSQREALTK
jgi:hypothetical protein